METFVRRIRIVPGVIDDSVAEMNGLRPLEEDVKDIVSGNIVRPTTIVAVDRNAVVV